MKATTISIGSKKDEKDLRKHIKINVTGKHMIGFFLFLMFLCWGVILALDSMGVLEKDLKFKCQDGKEEEIVANKYIYCGDHYSIIKDFVSEEQYVMMEDIINGR